MLAAAAVQTHAQEAPVAATAPPKFEQILVAGEYRYARTRRAGVLVSFDRGHTWQARGNGLPRRVVYPFPDPPEYAAVTSLAADPVDPRRLAATTASGVYLSSNGGMAWQRVATEQLHPHAYFTSVALSPHDTEGMLVGTSFHGIYETGDGGATWQHLTPAIRFLTDRSLFYEEVAGLSYDPAAPSAMAVLAGFDGGVFYLSNRFGEQHDTPGTGLLRFPVPAMATVQIGYAAAGDGWELHAGTIDAYWRLTADGAWSPIAGAEPLRRGVPLQPPRREPAPDTGAPAGTTDDAGRSAPPAPGAEAAADAAPEAGTEAPAPPAADASQPATPDTETAAPATNAEAPSQPAADAGQPAAPDTATADPATAAAEAPSHPAADAGQPAAQDTETAGPATSAEAPSHPAADASQPAAPDTATADPATDAEAPSQPAADASQPAAPDTKTADPATAAAGAPEQPQPAADGAQPAPAHQAPQPEAGAEHTALAAADDSGRAAPAAQAEHDHADVSVAGIAPGLPRVPPPECTTAEHADEDPEHAAARQPQPAADRQPAAPLAAAAEPAATDPATGQHGAPAPATAARHGAGTAAAPASAAPEGAGHDGAHLAAAPAAAQDTAGGSGTEICDDEHMLAAGEPGWIAGPEGIGTAAPMKRAARRNGIYIRADRAAEALPEYLDLLVRHGLDSLVIDFKDDFGRLGYDSDLPLARAVGAAPGPIKLDRLVADAHAAGIYVIARLVVFKDPVLYDWDSHRLAIWDREQDAPWRHLVPAGGDDPEATVQREHWVDPFAPLVWEYNVDVAAELAARGVDEIQFDYIRFPSDGPTEHALYRYRRPGMRRMDAIESFLAVARERLEVPISTDLFGFNSWYRAGNFIGQDIGVLADYADVISPMFYPSHFPGHFLDDRGYVERAHDIYESGVRRAQRMVQGRAYIRPYVQAFLIGGELRMEEEEYSRYLTRQLDGNRAAAGSGFTLWNASNRYYMVTEPLQPYFDTRGEETP